MVGFFCSMYIVLILCMSRVTHETQALCPAKCACLADYVECLREDFTKLPSNIPTWTTRLNLNSNKIHTLDTAVLNKLPQLKELKLNRNKITNLYKETFKEQRNLNILELNRNHLEKIEPLSFKFLGNLTILRLRKNRISQILDGAFWGLNNIETLELDGNSISVLSRAGAYGLQNLRSLSISSNRITIIEQDVWEFCKGLVELDLSINQLTSISKTMFKYLSKLEKLNLNENDISQIEEGAFYNTPELKVLLLNNNKLSWTVEDINGAFVGLNSLLKFHLASNNIKSINKNAFTELKSISTLDLRGNNITTIQSGALSAVPNLRQLYLNTTTMLCNCDLQGFVQWIQDNRFIASQITAICDYPVRLHGKSLVDLSVSNLSCDDIPKPNLIEEPKVKMALKGNNVTLFCKAVSSSPNPMSFTWKRDNVELRKVIVTETASSPDGKRTEVTSQLILVNISHEDQGRYQCIVSNNFGTTYSQKSRISVLIYPKFTKVPENVTAETGKTVKLECAAHGEPQPQIAWQKDGGNDFPAARERRMHVIPSDDVFFIVNVKTADMGVYSCTAQNPAGSIVANATLTVLEMPSFVKPMENKEITAGEPIVLECKATGSPKPTLTWLKDGGPLKVTDRHFFTAEDQLMIIVDTTLSDAGVYECLMNNSLGTEHGTSELLVLPNVSMNDDSSDTVGIIIITVVCCAVGTSIVWVVIIYQTKRVNTANVINTGAVLPDNFGNRMYMDNSSDHSSCKDSGTGDSAKHSSVGDNFNLLPETDEKNMLNPCPDKDIEKNSQLSNVTSQQTYTNHDREQMQQEQHLIEIHISDKNI